MKIVAAVNYPLNGNSRRTVERAVEIAEENEGSDLVVLHVNLYQQADETDGQDLRSAVETEFGGLDAKYRVREGFLVEELICEEAVKREADLIVIGSNRRKRWKRFLMRLIGNEPDILSYMRENTDIEIEVVG